MSINSLAESRKRFEKFLLSVKTQAKRNAYNRKRRTFLKAHRICAVCHLPGTDTVHHKRGRKGDALLDDTNFLAVHQKCDLWIHQNQTKAKAQGLLL